MQQFPNIPMSEQDPEQTLSRLMDHPKWQNLLEANQTQITQTKAAKQKSKLAANVNLLLSRSSFGISPYDVTIAETLGFDGYLAYQFDLDNIDTSFVDDLLTSIYPEIYQDSYQELIEKSQADPNFQPGFQLSIAAIVQALFSPAQLQEVMVEFWSNHFNVAINDGPIRIFKPIDDRENIRPHALGKFRDLLFANAKSPAMLFYLDGYTNTATGPNENYARELMELHTLGVNGGYTEEDVREVARCFTGWTLSIDVDGLFVFAPQNHDTGEKTVLSTTITAGGGIEDGEQVLELLNNHPATAHFIAEKLCRRFISDQPEQSIIDAVATTFQNTDGDIKAMLTTIFESTEFAQSTQLKFKRPMEYVSSMFRTLQPMFANNTFRLIFNQIEGMNQLPFFFPAPTGYPDVGGAWLNSNALLNRWNLGLVLALGQAQTADPGEDPVEAPHVSILSLMGDARTPAEITDVILAQVLQQPVSQHDRDTFIAHAALGFNATTPLPLDVAANSARAALSAILISRHFQHR